MTAIKDIFSGGGRVRNPTAFSVSTPAYRLGAQLDAEGRGLNTSFARTGTGPQLAFDARFPRILSDLDTIRGTVKPGFSQLRESALSAVRNRGAQALGNLRENLARRRVAGSSFGEDALIRAQREIADQESQTVAQSFLAELEANTKLLTQEANHISTALNRELAELQIGTGFASNISSLLTQAAQAEAQIKASNAQAGFGALTDIAGLGLGFGLKKAFPSALEEALARSLGRETIGTI